MASEFEPFHRAIFPASGIVHWLDGSSAPAASGMARVEQPLTVAFDPVDAMHPAPPPADLRILHRPGGFAFWQDSDARERADATAAEADYLLAPRPAYRLRGSVSDAAGNYSPRRFDIEIAAIAAPQPPSSVASGNIVLYPTPKGVRVPAGGALRGTLRWPPSGGETVGQRVPWALVQLTLVADSSVVFRTLSDRHGDFVVPMGALPAAREGIPTQDVTLRIRASQAASPDVWPENPESQSFVDIGQLRLVYPDEAVTPDPAPATIPFTDQPGLAVQPGKTGLIRTVQHDHVVVQTL